VTAAEGRGEAPTPPRPVAAVAEPAGRVASVEDAARRLVRAMRDGTFRNRNGTVYKSSVVEKYEVALRTSVLPKIGAVPITALTPGDVQRLVDELAAEKTPEHAKKALTGLRVALRLCERYGELDANPCTGTRVPVDGEGECEKPPMILTPEESATIVAAAEADDLRLGRSFAGPLVGLAFGSGLRLGELLVLPYGPEGLDLDAGIVHVTRALDRIRDESGVYPFIAPKSRASRRQVPLAPEDVARLRRHRLATGRPDDGELVFGGPAGRRSAPCPPTGRGSAPAPTRSGSRRRRRASCQGSTTAATATRPPCWPQGSAHTALPRCSATRTRPWSTSATGIRSRTRWQARASG
jgi:integrase